MKQLLALAALVIGGTTAAQTPGPAKVSVTRFDCGTVAANDLNQFSDTDAYVGKSRRLVVSCYLIRHGDDLMLWDTGLPAAMKGKPIDPKLPMDATVTRTLTEQLAQLGIEPARIGRIGISHYHFDHIGQAASFPGATLLIGDGDWTALKTPDSGANPAPVQHWVGGAGKAEPVKRDKDVWGDGSVVMLNMPGHTPGHHALRVRLGSGKVLMLTGDLAHLAENYANNGVPSFNTDRADTLASLDRFKAMARNTGATVIIGHEAADVAKLPAFPKAAE